MSAESLFRHLIWIFVCPLVCLSAVAVLAQNPPQISTDGNTLTVEDVRDTEIFAFGKSVVVRKQAKGVLALGGDVIVEGNVEGDVATIGGSVIQKENAFIGGDVIVFGGTYKHEQKEPLRNPGRETVMYAGYEEELRNAMQNPSQIFAPQFSAAFLAQRLLSTLFWFIVSLAVTTIAPGAVSRAVARLQLSTLKVVGIGLLGFLTITVGVIVSLRFLPGYISPFVVLMASVILLLAFFFGRVSLNVGVGKWLLKMFRPEDKHSESVALFVGTLFWTILLSVPYVWTFAVFGLFVASLGLVFTARGSEKWQKI